MNFNYISDNLLSISVDEKDDFENISQILSVFSKAKKKNSIVYSNKMFETSNGNMNYNLIDNKFKRTDNFLEYEVFNSYHSETDLMRYIKSLENKDLSLTHAMIPLGSCTMKLNAAVELFLSLIHI